MGAVVGGQSPVTFTLLAQTRGPSCEGLNRLTLLNCSCLKLVEKHLCLLVWCMTHSWSVIITGLRLAMTSAVSPLCILHNEKKRENQDICVWSFWSFKIKLFFFCIFCLWAKNKEITVQRSDKELLSPSFGSDYRGTHCLDCLAA